MFNYNGTYDYTGMLQAQIDGKVDSWAIRWQASAYVNGMLCLYPRMSLIQNIGFGEDGTHCTTDSYESSVYIDNKTNNFPKIQIQESRVMRKEWEKLFREIHNIPKRSITSVVKNKIKVIVKRSIKW